MRRIAINLFALLVIGVGGSYLGGLETAQASSGDPLYSCRSTPGSGGCSCVSGDGNHYCTGDVCTSYWNYCRAHNLPTQVGPLG